MPKNKRKTKNFKKGFLLIELLIALGIMAIISGITFIQVLPQITKGKDAVIKEDIIQIRNALMLYYDDNKCFPDSLPACHQDFIKGNTTYFKNFPCDPYGKPYTYQTDGNTCHTWFKVLDDLGNTNDKSIDSVGCRGGCGKMCNYNYGVSSPNISLNQGCPQPPQNYYACMPSGQCVIFANPIQSRCPVTFLNDPTCQNKCLVKANRCHDSSGKQN